MSKIGLQSSHCQQVSFNALNVICLRTRAQICIYLFLLDTSVSNSGKHPTEPTYCVARLNLISFCFYQFLLSGFTSFNHLLIATFSQCWLITAQQLLVNSIVGLLLVTNWILLCGHISIKNGDCKDKEHCMGESWNACPCTPTQTHTQYLFTALSVLENVCPGEFWDHCAVLLLSHCLVLVGHWCPPTISYLICSAVNTVDRTPNSFWLEVPSLALFLCLNN